MSPATILLILQAVQAAITEAPQIAEIVVKAKDFIASLFAGGVITKQQQDAMHAHVDAVAALMAAGITPPHWQVQIDPVPVKG